MEVDCNNMLTADHTGHLLSSLNILLVSDTHYALSELDALTEVMKEEKVDLVLHSGDIVDLPMDNMDVAADVEEQRRAQVGDVISKLSTCGKGAPVYYIPGNHDPRSMFGDWSPMSKSSVMIHKSLCRVTPSLVLAGFGGSVPGYVHGQQVWKGYPFNSNEEMETELRPLMEAIAKEPASGSDPGTLHVGDSVLFVSHVGPDGSDTALDRSCHGTPQNSVHGGSTYWGKAITGQEVQCSVVLNIHGHTHAGYGYSHIGAVPIINPGSLKEKRYGRLVVRHGECGRWQVDSITFHTLP
eukprot:scpid87315/ scgid6916/ 